MVRHLNFFQVRLSMIDIDYWRGYANRENKLFQYSNYILTRIELRRKAKPIKNKKCCEQH